MKFNSAFKGLCWNHEPCLIDVEAEHAEGDVYLQNRHM